MRSSNAAVRAKGWLLFFVLSSGCTHSVASVPVSPEVVRDTAIRVSDGHASAVMRDENGDGHTVNENTVIWLDRGSTTLGTIHERCGGGRSGGTPCPFGDGSTEFRLAVDHAAPDWPRIGAGAALIGFTGGLVALNAGCFSSWCNAVGRTAVVTLDVATVISVAAVVWWVTTVAPALNH
jgi:hypothetical protein